MNKFLFISILVFSFIIVSCGKDKGDCLRDDFLGTYTGLSQCERQTAVDASIVVTLGAAEDELILDLDGSSVTVKVDGCTFSGEEKSQDIDINYSGSLDANKITVELKGTILGIELDCKSEAIK